VFHLSGKITVPAADLERVRRALPEHLRLTRSEPGCQSFTVTEQEGGIFQVDETFINKAAFQAHQTRIRGTDWEAASASAARDYRTWES
jgi:quinol monooxygenase YgiN